MRKLYGSMLVVMVLGAPAWAEMSMGLLHDNYLGKPASVDPDWELPYDRVLGLSSERDTFVDSSWTADDLVVPPLQFYTVQQIKWIALVEEHPDADYSRVEVAIYQANPDPSGDPILESEPSLVADTVLDVDSFVSLNDTLGDKAFYEGTITLPPDMQPVLSEGHYYYSVRIVGNHRGRHHIASTGGDAGYPDENIFGGLEMGAFRSRNFFHNHWVDVDELLEIPNPDNPSEDIPYATDFSYQVWGIVTPEPASFVLLLVSGLMLRPRR